MVNVEDISGGGTDKNISGFRRRGNIHKKKLRHVGECSCGYVVFLKVESQKVRKDSTNESVKS